MKTITALLGVLLFGLISALAQIPVPSITALTPISDTQIDIDWYYPSPTDASNFDIERTRNGTAIPVITQFTVSAAVRHHSDTGLQQNTSYSYRIRARFPDNSVSGWSALNGPVQTALYPIRGVNGDVYAVAVDEATGNVYVGGHFSQAGNQPVANIAIWHTNTSTWSDFFGYGLGISCTDGYAMGGDVNAITIQSNRVYVGGNFSFAQLLTVPNTTLYLQRVAYFDTNSETWSDMGGGVTKYQSSIPVGGCADGIFGRVKTILCVGTNTYVGGVFDQAGPATNFVAVTNVAFWNGNTWTAMGVNFTETVNALATGNGYIFAGGFGNGNTAPHYVAQWKITNVPPPVVWDFLGTNSHNDVFDSNNPGATTGLYGPVKALEFATNGNLYIGGSFRGNIAPDPNAQGLFVWNPNKSNYTMQLGADVPFNAVSVNDDLSALKFHDGDLFVAATGFRQGGANYGGSSSVMLRWNGTTMNYFGHGLGDRELGPDAYIGTVYAIATNPNDPPIDSGGKLYAGGNFSSAGANCADHIAWSNGTNWFPMPNNLPSVTITSPLNGSQFQAPASVPITVNVFDDCAVGSVQILTNGTFAATLTVSPWTYTLPALGVGTYTISAQATDNDGGISPIDQVTITVVTNTTIPPTNTLAKVLWLKADAGVSTDVNGRVTVWRDQSGNNNHAAQGDVNKRPFLVPNVLNGLPVIRFDGDQTSQTVGDFLNGHGDLSLTDAYTSFLVYSMAPRTSNVAEQVPCLIGIPNQRYEARVYYIRYGFELGNVNEMTFSSWGNDFGSAFVVPANTYRIWTDRLSAEKDQLEFFDTDGENTFTATQPVSALQTPGAGYYVGGLGDQQRNFKGDIAEIIYYRGVLTEAERLAVENELKEKYGLPYLSAPSMLTATAVSSTRIDLTWADNSNSENGFRVERKAQGESDSTYTVIATLPANATSFSDTTVSPGTGYCYRIQAFNASGNSSYCPEACAETPPTAVIALWLRADTGVVTDENGRVSEWQDQSGNGNHAYQADPNMRPSLVSDALNGLPVIHFDGNQNDSTLGDFLHGTEDLGLTGAYTSFLVYSMADRNVDEQFLCTIGVPGQQYHNRAYSIRNGFEMAFSAWGDDSGSGFSVPANTYRIWTDRINSDKTQLDFFDTDGENHFTASAELSGLDTPGAGYYVGGLGEEQRNFQGDIVEVIYYRGILGDAERQAIEEGLRQKYDLHLLPHPSLWLKADAGVVADEDGYVSEWQDQSGSENHAVQADPNKRPLLVQDALNGHPALRFDGNQDDVSLGDFLQGTGDVGLNGGYTSFMVYSMADRNIYEQVPSLVGVLGESSRVRGYYIRNGFSLGNVNEMALAGWGNDYGSGFVVPANTYRIWTDRINYDMTQVDFFDTDGVSSFSSSVEISGLDTPGAGYYVGGLDGQQRNFQGDIVELIYYAGVLTDSERRLVERQLMEKYGTQ